MMKKVLFLLFLAFSPLCMLNTAGAAPSASVRADRAFAREYLDLVKALNRDFSMLVTSLNMVEDEASADAAAVRLATYANQTGMANRLLYSVQVSRNMPAIHARLAAATRNGSISQKESLEIQNQGQTLAKVSNQFHVALDRVVENEFYYSEALLEVIEELFYPMSEQE